MSPAAKDMLIYGAAAAVVGSLPSCKKYPDGPSLSLASKKARLAGEWELVDASFPIPNSLELFMEFAKDGDFEWTFKYVYYGFPFSYTSKGDWEFSSDKESLRIDVDGDKYDWEIKRLSNKELWFEDQDDKEDYEFEKV